MLEQLYAFCKPLDLNGVLTALLCGALIGLERQARGRPAGIRTCMLICLGAQTFVALGQLLTLGQDDSTRILGQVVTGIGFLGAGVILARGGLVLGVTSASVIWMLAAIGSAIGLGFYSAAIVLTVVTLAVLVLVDLAEKNVERLRQGVHAPRAIADQTEELNAAEH